jgi:flagellin-specific chaperone FliS
MRAYQAYRQQKNRPLPRIDLILTLYRKALDQIEQAIPLLQQQDSQAAQPFLIKARLIVAGMGAGIADNTEESAGNFQRLYEFVSFKLAQATIDDVFAARKVMRTLLEAFEAVRDQALTLESEGAIAPIGETHHVHLSI